MINKLFFLKKIKKHRMPVSFFKSVDYSLFSIEELKIVKEILEKKNEVAQSLVNERTTAYASTTEDKKTKAKEKANLELLKHNLLISQNIVLKIKKRIKLYNTDQQNEPPIKIASLNNKLYNDLNDSCLDMLFEPSALELYNIDTLKTLKNQSNAFRKNVLPTYGEDEVEKIKQLKQTTTNNLLHEKYFLEQKLKACKSLLKILDSF